MKNSNTLPQRTRTYYKVLGLHAGVRATDLHGNRCLMKTTRQLGRREVKLYAHALPLSFFGQQEVVFATPPTVSCTAPFALAKLLVAGAKGRVRWTRSFSP